MEYLDRDMLNPNILYKYRDYENKYHRDFLFKQELYFSSIDSLNDPYEGVMSVDKLIDRFINCDKKNRKCENDNLRAIKRWQKELLDETKAKIRMSIKSCDNGIFSLSKDPFCNLMWTHYSGEHKGFCVGLNRQKLLECVGSNMYSLDEISYSDSQPDFKFTESPFMFHKKRMLTKSKEWEYEKEMRMISIGKTNHSIRIDLDVFDVVFLGNRMLPESRKAVISYLRENCPSCNIYDIEMSPNSYSWRGKIVKF